MTDQSSAASQHDLHVDEQVAQFLDLNHKLTFFLITASVGTLGFTLTFATTGDLGLTESGARFGIIFLASIAALTSAWCALTALRYDQDSFRLHLRYRYAHKTWEQLTKEEQAAWDNVTKAASRPRRAAFSFLLTTVLLQVVFLLFALVDKGDLPMHHYGEDSTAVVASDSTYRLVFTNKVSGAKITMDVPRVGALEDPTKSLDPNTARHLANEVAHLLRGVLE